jgi:elongator complex protein 6
MPSQLALPHLLTPYVVSPPQSSLTVVSSVLGATGNWLVLRFLYAALGNSPVSHPGYGVPEFETRKKRRVVLVSFLRGWEFWRSEAKRLVCPPAHWRAILRMLDREQEFG